MNKQNAKNTTDLLKTLLMPSLFCFGQFRRHDLMVLKMTSFFKEQGFICTQQSI